MPQSRLDILANDMVSGLHWGPADHPSYDRFVIFRLLAFSCRPYPTDGNSSFLQILDDAVSLDYALYVSSRACTDSHVLSFLFFFSSSLSFYRGFYKGELLSTLSF